MIDPQDHGNQESEDEAIDLFCEETETDLDGEEEEVAEREEEQPPPDREEGVVARRLISLCGCCDRLVAVWSVGTSDAAVVLHALVLSERLNLLCDECVADLDLEGRDGE